ncbi:hypothetical protein SCLCIDRAFT_34522 [Scleroderma citrinum Foug A]|uniref:Uncharacterized protein n=1 Tax=Scleroderma citrinum Foug A TaxID=1036808 RepID=A0A0C3CNM4_9AGAM|nr:hypothetical protein SCLCIDRAFT_34522 [Scleroderma citrinum Foug A]
MLKDGPKTCCFTQNRELQLIMQLHATGCQRFGCSPSKIQKFHNQLQSGCLKKRQKDWTGPDF